MRGGVLTILSKCKWERSAAVRARAGRERDGNRCNEPAENSTERGMENVGMASQFQKGMSVAVEHSTSLPFRTSQDRQPYWSYGGRGQHGRTVRLQIPAVLESHRTVLRLVLYRTSRSAYGTDVPCACGTGAYRELQNVFVVLDVRTSFVAVQWHTCQRSERIILRFAALSMARNHRFF